MRNHLKLASSISHLLDSKFQILGFKFGIDPIFGLIPGIGDFISLTLALYILWIGLKMELPQHKIKQILLNILLDFGIGVIPVVGDLADFVFKSNLKNLQILKQHVEGNIIEGEIVK